MRSDEWLRKFLVALLGLLIATRGVALDEGDVDALGRECEAARQEALAPIRARRTQSCIEQQLRTVEACEHYYTTYGNVRRGPSGAPTSGYFYNLPECQEWLRAREALLQSRSNP